MRRLAVVLLVVALGGCGGGSGDPPRPAALADKIGCSDYEAEVDQLNLFAREQGSCVLGDERLTILTYRTNDNRDDAVRIGHQFGGIAVIGDRFVVAVDSQATAEKVARATGGKVD